MLNDKQFVAFQKLLPKKLITEIMGWFAERHVPVITPMFMRWFAKRFNVDMTEAEQEQLAAYRTFNDFFTRPLKDGARKIEGNESDLVSPVDGTISQMTSIGGEQMIQAKGKRYSLSALLAHQKDLTQAYRDGEFTTIYLSPRDYHRIHMPITGTLRSMIYVPGKLYSVNPATVNNLDNLFSQNERVICQFDTELGPMAMILVGATIVGSIETVWSGTITPPRSGEVTRWHYGSDNNGQDADQHKRENIVLQKGQEMGRFKLGSTVILTFAKDAMAWKETFNPGDSLRLGEKISDDTRHS